MGSEMCIRDSESWINEMLQDVTAEDARAMAARLTAFAAQKEEKEIADAQ